MASLPPGADPDNVSAAPPPPNVTANLIDPPNQLVLINTTVIVCLSFATVFVWLRLYTKIFVKRSHGWEDYTSFVAWAAYVGYCALPFINNKNSDGNHIWDTSLAKEEDWLKFSNANQIYYGPLIFITKLSILLLYMRIFVVPKTGGLYYTIQFLVWLNALFYFADTMAEILQCVPRRKIWNPTVKGHCINVNAAYITTAAVNVVSDFSILALPLFCVWHLQMPTRRKIGISAMFATGFFGCITSIMRLVAGVQNINSKDPNHDLVSVALWTHGEITSGIVCGCLPVLPQFFRHYVPKVRSKLTLHKDTKTSPHNTSKYGKGLHGNKPLALPQDPYHIRLLPGNYLELNERNPQLGPSTIIHGGAHDANPDNSAAVGKELSSYDFTQPLDVESTAGDGQILKTVRLERSSN